MKQIRILLEKALMEDSQKKIAGLRKDGTPIYFDSLDFQKRSKILSQLSELDEQMLKVIKNTSKKEENEHVRNTN
jgi:hypothetical protein